jgi:hypothetical protein
MEISEVKHDGDIYCRGNLSPLRDFVPGLLMVPIHARGHEATRNPNSRPTFLAFRVSVRQFRSRVSGA